LDAVVQVNEAQKTILFPEMKNHFMGDLKGKTIGIWGLAFKPETDDIREAPSLYMIDKLTEAGAEVKAFDPEAMPNVKSKIGGQISYCDSMYAASKDVDALLICTEWSIFRTPDFKKLKAEMKTPVIFDGRNLYEIEEMTEAGFRYSSIGRKHV
ncbi:MAG: UDP-glucose 6-dehydrogenase, partial [Psychroflexus sp.]|nr:UDP-glucose 6-dehydrogenase [Psychroflexus sp.]